MNRDIVVFIEETGFESSVIAQIKEAVENSIGEFLFCVKLPEGIEKLKSLSSAGHPPKVVVIGSRINAPSAAAKQIHKIAPNAQIVFAVDDGEAQAKLRNSLLFAAVPGTHWVFGSAANPQALIKTLERAAQVAKQRRQLRTTLDKINFKLSSAAPPADSPDFRQLVISDRYLVSILAQARDAIISIDLHGKIISVNRAAADSFGCSEQELIGEPIENFVAETQRENLRKLIAARIDTRNEFTARRADGATFDIELSIAVVSDETGDQQLGLVLTAHDISEHKRRERRLAELLESEQEARRKAEEADKIKDEFLATLSHELRTPLNAILGWSQMLQNKNFGEAEAKKGLSAIERNARSQNQLIDDLLDVSRIITGKLRLDVRAVDLSNVIAAAIDVVRPAAEAKNIRLQILLDPSAGLISGDPDRLQQVVWNLLSNAVKFTPKDGRVQVRLERVNSHVEITVSDTGSGIEPQFLPHVFDRFRQSDGSTTRRHGGLGLGLAIVRQIVELHGGTVAVESDGAEQGATFSVHLPLLPVRREPASDVPRVHPKAETGSLNGCPPELDGLRVLIVDDEADSRDLLNLVLESCGAAVETAATAAEAFERIKSERFDVVVSDIGMPEEDGFSLIGRIRNLSNEQGGDVSAIALTAYARAEDRVRALRSGFQMHVAKPVEPDELVVAVANLAGRMRNPKRKETE